MKILIIIIILSTSSLAQGINWGFRLDAHLVNTDYINNIGIEKNETYYPRFFTSPQLMLNLYPIEQAGIEIRTGYDFIVTDFEGGEYSFYGKYHVYQPLYILGGVCLKKIAAESSHNTINHRGGRRFGMPAIGVGGQITKHISAELIYLHGNNRLIANSYNIYSLPYIRTDTYLKYVIKLSAGFNWSIYDF